MSIFVLKLIALVTMIIDHSAAVLYDSVAEPVLSSGAVYVMRLIGRIALPLYAFLLVEGFRHTRDWRKYTLRLLGLGLFSQLPYAFTINGWVAFSEMPWWRRVTDLNILFTLTLGVLMLAFLNSKRPEKPLDSWGAPVLLLGLGSLFAVSRVYDVAIALGLAAILLAVSHAAPRLRWAAGQAARFALFAFPLFWLLKRDIPLPGGAGHLSFDYDIFGLALIAALFWAKTPRRSAVVIAIWGIWCYMDWVLALFVAASALCVAFYNGQKGKNDRRLFYWAYPAHLFLLWAVLLLVA